MAFNKTDDMRNMVAGGDQYGTMPGGGESLDPEMTQMLQMMIAKIPPDKLQELQAMPRNRLLILIQQMLLKSGFPNEQLDQISQIVMQLLEEKFAEIGGANPNRPMPQGGM